MCLPRFHLYREMKFNDDAHLMVLLLAALTTYYGSFAQPGK